MRVACALGSSFGNFGISFSPAARMASVPPIKALRISHLAWRAVTSGEASATFEISPPLQAKRGNRGRPTSNRIAVRDEVARRVDEVVQACRLVRFAVLGVGLLLPI